MPVKNKQRALSRNSAFRDAARSSVAMDAEKGGGNTRIVVMSRGAARHPIEEEHSAQSSRSPRAAIIAVFTFCWFPHGYLVSLKLTLTVQ
jgi:hypothetical protein